MTAKFQLVIDCADPEPLAGFWGAALGYTTSPSLPGAGEGDNAAAAPFRRPWRLW